MSIFQMIMLLVPLIVSPQVFDGRGETSVSVPALTDIVLPAGFAVTEIATDLSEPTDMIVLPSSDILVTQRGAGVSDDGRSQVRLIRNGVLRTQPVIELSTNVGGEAGLLAIAADPNISVNGRIYLWYTVGKDAKGWSGSSSNRLSRFTFDAASGTADTASEVILLDDVPWETYHNGCGLVFDKNGLLYISLGDAAQAAEAQNMESLLGKLLRIRPTSSGMEIPSSNPYVNDPNVRSEIYASGLRNPWRMTKRSSDDSIFIADVGLRHWEEVDLAAPKANYGWPEREGPCPLGQLAPCSAAPAQYADPVAYYAHEQSGVQGNAITGIAFSEGNAFPEPYAGGLFFAEFNLQYISVMKLGTPGDFDIIPFATAVGNVLDLEFHNDHLFYLVYTGGKIGMIYHTGTDNQIPVARLSSDVTSGSAPLTVQLSAEGSYDTDDVALDYIWGLGDGTPPQRGKAVTLTHTFLADGNYDVTLKVVDIRGGESDPAVQRIVVYSGEMPEIALTNLSDSARSTYHGGDTWQFEAKRANGVDGLDPQTPYTWDIELGHNQHSHPALSDQTVISGTFDIGQDNHGGDWNIWYRFKLTMKTDTGQEIEIEQDLFPAYSTLHVDSIPVGASVTVNGAQQTLPHEMKAIVGTEHTLEAVASFSSEDAVVSFDHWYSYGDGWPATSDAVQDRISDSPQMTFVVPEASTRYIAFYSFQEALHRIWLPLIVK